MSQARLLQEVGIAVFDIAKDTAQQQSQQLIQAMQQSVQPHLGGTIDLKV